MSMAKRYLESLPKEQQDDILGVPPDEWVESAENEPEDEEESWWAQTSKILGLSPDDVYADDEED